MISVGIDVSKEKSTVCVLKPYGEIVMKPTDVLHTYISPRVQNDIPTLAQARQRQASYNDLVPRS